MYDCVYVVRDKVDLWGLSRGRKRKGKGVEFRRSVSG